jgi:hypothetical protein
VWIARARAVPTRQLEQEVREIGGRAGPGGPEEVAPEQRVALRCTPAAREKWSAVCELAERLAGQRLRAGEVLELVAAEALSAVSIHPAFRRAPRRAGTPRGGRGRGSPVAGGHPAGACNRAEPTSASTAVSCARENPVGSG